MPDLIRCNDPKCTKDDVHEPPCSPKRYCRYCKEQRTHGWDDCPFRLDALERMRLDREQGDLRSSTVDGARGFAESYSD